MVVKAPSEKHITFSPGNIKERYSVFISMCKKEVVEWVESSTNIEWVMNLGNEQLNYLALIQPICSGIYPYLCSDKNNDWFESCLEEHCDETGCVDDNPWINRSQLLAIFLCYLCAALRRERDTENASLSVPRDPKNYGTFVKYLCAGLKRYASRTPSLSLFGVWEGTHVRKPASSQQNKNKKKSVLQILKKAVTSKKLKEKKICSVFKKYVEKYLKDLRLIRDAEPSQENVIEIIESGEDITEPLDASFKCFLHEIFSVILRREFNVSREFRERLWHYRLNREGHSHDSLKLLLSD